MTKNVNFALGGFLGYGFNSYPGGNWQLSSYYPTGEGSKSNRSRTHYTFGDLKEYSIGVEANLKWGKRKHFLELGAGIALDYFDEAINFYSSRNTLGDNPSPEDLLQAKSSHWADHEYIRCGYRYVSKGGITLGVGVSFQQLEGFFTHFYVADVSTMPYLSIGYSF